MNEFNTTEMFKEYPDVISVETLAKMLCVGKARAYTLVNSGEIKSLRIGKKIKIAKVHVISYILSV